MKKYWVTLDIYENRQVIRFGTRHFEFYVDENGKKQVKEFTFNGEPFTPSLRTVLYVAFVLHFNRKTALIKDHTKEEEKKDYPIERLQSEGITKKIFMAEKVSVIVKDKHRITPYLILENKNEKETITLLDDYTKKNLSTIIWRK
jgi:hypothetical protein